ncbi:hypothetical protein OG230_16755 [Streptomyces sp. NBC_00234]|uniref:hypothetical protein n=1 Tax=Streptomyces sp. NBC_00234 TaxID=2903638 RepID=UPI002E2887A4|nr:hypothetical protein [Streptomyces sp. NBC_00234]
MENEGGVVGDPAEEERMARLVGALLIELGHKVQKAGAAGIRILTDEEAERDQVLWYRRGWEEHAHAADPQRAGMAGHPDAEGRPEAEGRTTPSGRLIQFPDQPDGDDSPQPLPIVGAGDATVRELMPHRPRGRPARGHGDDG